MNNRNPTHYPSQASTYSVIDLTICSTQDLYDSDHYPTQLKLVTHNLIPAKINKFNIKKENWDTFRQFTIINLNELPDVNTAIDLITNCIIGEAEQAIPRVKTNLQRPPMPWWNEECDDAGRARAERAVKQNPTEYNTIRYSRAKAKCRLIFNKRKGESWRTYVDDGINCRTNTKTVWWPTQ